jgi:hypothetical protein
VPRLEQLALGPEVKSQSAKAPYYSGIVNFSCAPLFLGSSLALDVSQCLGRKDKDTERLTEVPDQSRGKEKKRKIEIHPTTESLTVAARLHTALGVTGTVLLQFRQGTKCTRPPHQCRM